MTAALRWLTSSPETAPTDPALSSGICVTVVVGVPLLTKLPRTSVTDPGGGVTLSPKVATTPS